MDEIPEDVLRAATEALGKTWCASLGGSQGWASRRGAIAIAILAERQRCADVARKYKERDPAGDGSGHWAADEIAAAIFNP